MALGYKPQVIALCGNAGHGKDSFAVPLFEQLQRNGEDVDVFALADPLKQTVSKLLNVPLAQFYTEEGKKSKPFGNDKTLRDALVEISSTLKVFRPDIWLDKAVERCQFAGLTVITDVRNLKEEAYLREHTHLFLVRIVRPDPPYPPETYLTEMEIQVPLLTPDLTVYNEGTLEELSEKARKVAQTFRYYKQSL